MSSELYMLLDFIFFALALMGNVATIILAGCALVFAFRGIKVRK